MRAEGLAYREIGGRLGVSMTTARMWLKPEDAQRARQSNRQYHAENREQIAQRKRAYRKSNPVMAVTRNQRRREKYAADPDAARYYDAADKLRDGTHQRGERQGQHRLTAERVLEIRGRNAAGESQRFLAAEFGVSRSTIAGCVKRRNWAWL
jgi:transposase